MNPPLRSEKDRLAMIEGRKGRHDRRHRDRPRAAHAGGKLIFCTAPNGSIGMETSFAAAYTALVKTGVLTLTELIEKMSVRRRSCSALKPAPSVRAKWPILH